LIRGIKYKKFSNRKERIMENFKKRFESDAFKDDLKFYMVLITTASILTLAIIYGGYLVDWLHSVSGDATVWK
jgi:hypothetical protein